MSMVIDPDPEPLEPEPPELELPGPEFDPDSPDPPPPRGNDAPTSTDVSSTDTPADTVVWPDPLPLEPDEPDDPDSDEPDPDDPEPLDVPASTEMPPTLTPPEIPSFETPEPETDEPDEPAPDEAEEPPPDGPDGPPDEPDAPLPDEPEPDEPTSVVMPDLPGSSASGCAGEPAAVPPAPVDAFPGTREPRPRIRAVCPPTRRTKTDPSVNGAAARRFARPDATSDASPGACRTNACCSGVVSARSSMPAMRDPATRSTMAGNGMVSPLTANSGTGRTTITAKSISSRLERVNAEAPPGAG
jgi:hypothetical protein